MAYTEPQVLDSVAKFQNLFGVTIPDTPQIPSPQRCQLNIDLLQEELDEFAQAIADGDIVEIADALGDMQYLIAGAVCEFGLADRFADIFAEIQRSNMSKACDTLADAEATVKHYISYKNEEGYIVEKDGKYIVYRKSDDKVLKSINYHAVDLGQIVE